MTGESVEVVIARIDENVKDIKSDYMTQSKTDLCVERAVVNHERKQHKRLNIAAVVTLLTAIITVTGALLYAFA